MSSSIQQDFRQVTKVSTWDVQEDGRTVVALCTTSGQLLELVDNRVVDSCDIDEVADDITTFTAYDPLQKYYLLRCQDKLVVVKRSKPLCVIKTYDKVVEVDIQDRLRIGRPQVVIRTQNDQEPIITDFTGQLQIASPHIIPLLTASLSGKLQEMNARVAKARWLLQEKRCARYKAMCRFTSYPQPPVGDTECEPKVLVWGPPPPSAGPLTDPPLLLSHPWKKIHNGKWIIGVPVFNTTATVVHDVRLRLFQSSAGVMEPELKYRCLLLGFGQRNPSEGEWAEPCHSETQMLKIKEIAGKRSALIIGLLEEPLFKKTSLVSISGTLIYKHDGKSLGEDVQHILGAEVHFKVEDLIHGTLSPFSPQNDKSDESDLVSVIVSSTCWELSAFPRHRLSGPLSETLAQAGLVQVKELGCWVGPSLGGGSLAGLLVVGSGASKGSCILHVYVRELKQVLHFVHSVQGQWKIEECRTSAASVQDCIRNLRTELCTLQSITRPGVEYSADEWDQIRDNLDGLELATDLSFASHSSL